jgi:nucleoside-diphosphate-sugar epimerase
MRLLVLGGTAYVGRAVASRAVADGYQVVCAARGVSGPVPVGATLLRVDRDAPQGLAPLEGQRFDAVVDVSSRPSQVRRAVAALAGRVGHWCYVSSASVYADVATPGQRAGSAPVLAPAPEDLDDPQAPGDAYGRCKVACEQAVLDAGVPAFVCRAGLIVGPEDDSDRFTYWPARLARGGEVLAPGRPDDAVQLVDVRDLAAWLVSVVGDGRTGVFDGIAPPTTRLDLLRRVSAGVGRPEPELTWVNQDFLAERGVRPWAGEHSLPLWLPLPGYAGFMARDVSASAAAGLAVRDLRDTARATLDWYRSAGEPALSCGLGGPDEAQLLAAWHART